MSANELLALGRVDPADAGEEFCMTVLALKASRAANGCGESIVEDMQALFLAARAAPRHSG